MRMDHSNFTSISSGSVDAKPFGIEFDAVVAYTLMSGIAKNKIAYPVREVGANAFDANPSTPFDVQLPTWLDPTFRVRDYGPGLSHDDVMSIYTTFGGSGKRHTNDLVGGLGYGSKSPFAYLISKSKGAASFTVISYHDQQAHTYIMALAASGMPEVRYFGAAPTDAPSGIEVSFAVNKEDIDSFKDAAEAIYWHFPVRPNGVKFSEATILSSGANWTLYNSDAPFSDPHVRMGCVVYPINFSSLGEHNWPWRMSPIVFDAPIGSLSFTTSREELGYDVETIKRLKNMIEQFELDYAPKIQAQIDEASNYLQACGIFETLCNSHHGVEHLANQNKLLFKGKRLRKIFTDRKETVRLMLIEHDQADLNLVVEYDTLGITSRTDKTWQVTARRLEDVKTVIYSTTKDRNFKRLQQLTPEFPVLWIRYDSGSIDDAMERLGIDGDFTPIDLASVELPKRVKGAPQPKMRSTMYLASYGRSDTKSLCDWAQGGVYVTLYHRPRHKKDHFYVGGRTWGGRTITEAWQHLKGQGLVDKDQKLWVFMPGEVPAVGEWENFGVLLDRVLRPLVPDHEISKAPHKDLNYDLKKWLHQYPNLNADLVPADIYDFAKRVVAYHSERDRDGAASKNAEIYLQFRPEQIAQTHTVSRADLLAEEEEALERKYPLLSTITNTWSSWNASKLTTFEHYCSLLANQK